MAVIRSGVHPIQRLAADSDKGVSPLLQRLRRHRAFQGRRVFGCDRGRSVTRRPSPKAPAAEFQAERIHLVQKIGQKRIAAGPTDGVVEFGVGNLQPDGIMRHLALRLERLSSRSPDDRSFVRQEPDPAHRRTSPAERRRIAKAAAYRLRSIAATAPPISSFASMPIGHGGTSR